MNKRENTREVREDKVIRWIYLQAKQNQHLHSRLANLLHAWRIRRRIRVTTDSLLSNIILSISFILFKRVHLQHETRDNGENNEMKFLYRGHNFLKTIEPAEFCNGKNVFLKKACSRFKEGTLATCLVWYASLRFGICLVK